MPISRIELIGTGINQLVLDLNVIQRGWVTQILGGTFATTNSYSFTDGNLTNVEMSSIDINVRMTPAMTYTERTPEEVLSFLGGVNSDYTVRLIDTDFPDLNIRTSIVNATGLATTTLLESKTASRWSQKCVVHNVKYNYSEKPATIEFTVSTLKPFLEGSALELYHGLKNTPRNTSFNQISNVCDRLKALKAKVALRKMDLAAPAGAANASDNLRISDSPYFAHIEYSGGNDPGQISITTLLDGRTVFAFGGSLNRTLSYGYVSEAYPAISPDTLLDLIDNTLSRNYKINSSLGPVNAYAKFVLVKKGL